MTRTKRETLTVDEVMNILDHYDAELYEFLNHIMWTKAAGITRVEMALPWLTTHCVNLLVDYKDTDDAYDMQFMDPAGRELLEREMRRACA